MFGVTDAITEHRWISCHNSSGEDIPSYAALAVVGRTSDGQLLVDKPSISGQYVALNGPASIEINGDGLCTFEDHAYALYAVGSTAAAPGPPTNVNYVPWGAKADQWELYEGYAGFFPLVNGTSTAPRLVIVRRYPFAGALIKRTTTLTLTGTATIPYSTEIQFSSAEHDTSAFWTASSPERFTIYEPGWYHVTLNATFTNAGEATPETGAYAQRLGIALTGTTGAWVFGAQSGQSHHVNTSGDYYCWLSCSGVQRMHTGHYVTATAVHYGGVDNSVDVTMSGASMTISKLGGP